MDRAAQLIQRAIRLLEAHEHLDEVAAALEDLRNAAALTDGRSSRGSSAPSGVVRAISPSSHP